MNRKLWSVPRIWKRDTCFILGGGPGLAAIDIDRLRGKGRVIAVNCAYGLGNWFEAMFYGDRQWLRSHGAGLVDFAGLKITTINPYEPLTDVWVDSLRIRVLARDFDTEGISKHPEILFWNKSSGACAINLATLLGAGRIVLFGFDMQRVNGRSNYHDEYDPIDPPFDPFEKFLQPFAKIAADLKELDIECINATPGSALDVFPIVRPEDILAC